MVRKKINIQEPEVMKFFRDNDNKIKSRTEGLWVWFE
ncbi:MAG: hypothetical protein CM15mP10_3000 [Actinomycetota bacterium]|nr:MAG: hypothetical protein CM15mP10_3000 [Actinomycetota bacterium]